MLGRLAKWLRILGYDTAYFAQIEDRELVRIARAEGRILLTRDREVTRRKGVRSLFVVSDRFEDQLGQLLRDLDLDMDSFQSRCARCNIILRSISKAEVKDRVPAFVFRKHEQFTLCSQCGRVYWRGTHWERMRQRIEDIRGGNFTSS
jgi:uncharacterized protein with PIN domain